jgi:hypothetical protein
VLGLLVVWIGAHENHHCTQIKEISGHERDHCGQIGQLQQAVADLGKHLRNMSCEALPPSVTELIDDVRSDG